RIALLQMDYPPRMAGGTTIHTYQLANALNTIGNEVHVVAAAHPAAPKHEIKEGIHIYRVRRPYTAFSAVRTRKIMKGLDIVHGHGICAYGHLVINNFPTVVKMHNTWLGEYERYKELKGNIAKKMDASTNMKYYIKMDKSCCRRADHLICISEIIKKETKRYDVPDDKMTVIHNGIDLKKFDTEENFRDELGLSGVVVGYIGRLEPHKGVEFLIEALRNLDGNLLLVGGGSDQKRLEGLVKKMGIKDRVKFTGYVPYHDIPKYYASIDIVVYPTFYEPLGNVILESMAAGKPIIASKVGGIPEIFQEGTGFLVKPNTKTIQEKLKLLLDDEKLRKRMGAEGKKKVKCHSWEEVAKQTVNVCEKVLNQ
ncbi:MAG: glycosyltransferase family 4 protein, partial [Thermoplasmata archaeon]|nr:glycosyltransferase family 4 protein [Thermoplasmata archaeon]